MPGGEGAGEGGIKQPQELLKKRREDKIIKKEKDDFEKDKKMGIGDLQIEG